MRTRPIAFALSTNLLNLGIVASLAPLPPEPGVGVARRSVPHQGRAADGRERHARLQLRIVAGAAQVDRGRAVGARPRMVEDVLAVRVGFEVQWHRAHQLVGMHIVCNQVLRQLEDDPALDLAALPAGLAELYMDRYRRTFGGGAAGLAAFRACTAPMLGVLVAAPKALPPFLGGRRCALPARSHRVQI